jgi:hypothetical protein
VFILLARFERADELRVELEVLSWTFETMLKVLSEKKSAGFAADAPEIIVSLTPSKTCFNVELGMLACAAVDST